MPLPLAQLDLLLNSYGSLRIELAPQIIEKSYAMGTSSKVSSSAAVGIAGIAFKLIGAISNLQSESEIERCWLFFVKEIGRKIAMPEKSDKTRASPPGGSLVLKYCLYLPEPSIPARPRRILRL